MASGKHRKNGTPSTGNGVTGGRKPARLEVSQQTSTGTTLWKATAAMFGKGKKS
jgi:hypothetical protein